MIDRITVVYVDGYEEKYIVNSKRESGGTEIKNFKAAVEDGMLKLIMHDEQLVLIPFSNIRKIIYRPEIQALDREFPGFLHVKPDME